MPFSMIDNVMLILSTAVTGNANRGMTKENIGTLANSAVLA